MKALTDLTEIEQLKLARNEVERQKYLIKKEMTEKAIEGILWTNGKCQAWPDYEKALAKLEELRDYHGT